MSFINVSVLRFPLCMPVKLPVLSCSSLHLPLLAFRDMDFITRLESQFDYDRVSGVMLKYWSASLFISAAYVVIIFSIQRWMRDRKPYKLQRWLFAWSTALTGLSLIGFYRTGEFSCNWRRIQWGLSRQPPMGQSMGPYRVVAAF